MSNLHSDFSPEEDDEYQQNVPVHIHNFGFQDRPALAAEALNEFLDDNLPFGIDWKVSQRKWKFEFAGLTIEVGDAGTEGISVAAQSDVMPRRRLDPLRKELRDILSDALGELEWNKLSFGVMLLQMAESATWHLEEFQKWQLPGKKKRKVPGKGWDSTSVQDWTTILQNPHGVDLMTVNDTAKHILGQSISDIIAGCSIIGDKEGQLRVLHIEPVFRSDLVSRFLRKRKEMKDQLLELKYEQLRECVSRKDVQDRSVHNSAEGIAEYLTTPHVTFHGAPRSVISSIVRYGFLLPGEQIGKTGQKVQMECGSSFGVGVYSSPSLEYASAYGCWGSGAHSKFGYRNPADVPGMRIMVCATLMGRSLQVSRAETRRTHGLKVSHAQSHVSPEKMEYVVFDTAQIIPCYVLHIDFGSEKARAHFDNVKDDPLQKKAKPRVDTGYDGPEDWPAARVAKKEALKAAATKWFPYGYGPATGTQFVIEEIAEVSDDEEEYGEFQALRGEQEGEMQGWQESRAEGEKTSWFDEYQTVRTTYKDVKPESR